MFLQEKVREFNKKFEVLKNIKDIAVWGAGIHTAKLFEKTNLLSYDIKRIIDIDKKKQQERYFGFNIKSPEEIKWRGMGAVVISVPGKDNQISDILREEWGYEGIIISLYEEKKCMPFYLLGDINVEEICYFGEYDNWNNAYEDCKGYDDNAILEKVIRSTKKVLNCEAVWERDGYLFYEKKYNYYLCSAILRCAVQNGNQGVRILDIGGALGSSYFQNKDYLIDVEKLEYVVAEQKGFADYGHENIENKNLKFMNSEEKYGDHGRFDIALMSASLQYICNYKSIINKIIKARPRYIILDRVLISDRTRICKETVPKKIYESSYPVIIFTEKEIIDFFTPEYKLVEKDIASVPENIYFDDGKANSHYYVFKI